MVELAPAGSWAQLRPRLSTNAERVLVNEFGFEEMTPVQASTIPLFLQSRDVVVEAVTGSGKTFAYLLPIVEILMRVQRQAAAAELDAPPSIAPVQAIVIAPTRELAQQILAVLDRLLRAMETPLRTFLFTGGRSLGEDLDAYRKQLGAHIVVATPGKLETIVKEHSQMVRTKELEVLVLDEADRLLDLGFELSLRNILHALPKQRRTGLFSATMTDGLNELVKAGLRNPTRIIVKVEDCATKTLQRTPSTLHIRYTFCSPEEKLPRLLAVLHSLRGQKKKVIVYFCTCPAVDYYFKVLSLLPGLPFPVHSLHGKMDPKRRAAVYESFSQCEAGILLGTDVAARGLDIPDVDLVVQMDPPQDPQAFLHRCGRTARQGKEGDALVFLHPHEDTYVEFLRLRKVPMSEDTATSQLEPMPIPTPEPRSLPPSYPRVSDNADYHTALMRFIHSHMLGDRDLYQKSVTAFVSFLKSYKEHQLKFIFPFKALDLAAVARSFFLLRLPKCPELKQVHPPVNVPALVDPSVIQGIPFKDKQREKARLEAEDKKRQHPETTKKHKQHRVETVAWSEKKETKEKRAERRLKKDRKRNAIEKRKLEEALAQKSDAEDRQEEDGEDEASEWKALQHESRLLKKLKSGKISKKEFDEQCGDLSACETEEES